LSVPTADHFPTICLRHWSWRSYRKRWSTIARLLNISLLILNEEMLWWSVGESSFADLNLIQPYHPASLANSWRAKQQESSLFYPADWRVISWVPIPMVIPKPMISGVHSGINRSIRLDKLVGNLLFVQFCNKIDYLSLTCGSIPLLLNRPTDPFNPWTRDRNKYFFVNFIEAPLYLRHPVLPVSDNNFLKFLIQVTKEEEVTQCQVSAIGEMRRSLSPSCAKIFSIFLLIVGTCFVQVHFQTFQRFSPAM
jgi:hypothetical protein